MTKSEKILSTGYMKNVLKNMQTNKFAILTNTFPERTINPKELFEIIRKVEKGKRHFFVGLRNLLIYMRLSI